MAVHVKTLQRGSTYKLIFTIAATDYGKNQSNEPKAVLVSQPININNLVVADFKFLYYYHNSYKSKHRLQLQSANLIKAETVNMPLVPLKITCKAYSEQLYCTDKSITTQILQWSNDGEHHSNYTGVQYVIAFSFEVDIIILNTTPSATLPNNRNSLYDDKEFTDFELSTSDGSVPLHKAMLFMHSDMFKLMMRGEWKETSQGRISMDGVTVQTLQQLKAYMYLGTLPDEEVEIETLLQIAAHYFMDKLKADCIAKLSSLVTPENLDHLVQLACLHNLPDLVRVILLETPDSVVNSGFQLTMNKQQSEGQKSDE